MNADLPTMLLAIVMVGALLSVSVAFADGRSRREGMMFWAAALAMNTSSGLLLMAYQRGLLGEFPATLASTVLRSCAWAACAEGLYQFYRKPPPRALIWAPVALTLLAGIALFGNLTGRIVVVSLVIAAQCLLSVTLIGQKWRDTPGRGKYFLLAGLVTVVALLLLRAGAAASGASAALVSVTQPSQVQTLSTGASLLVLILMSLGFVLVSKDRADDLNRRLATSDDLTGLANRRSLNEVLASEWARSRRSGASLALVMIDVDHFKLYNDHYGHQVGDECLQRIAAEIRANARRTGDLAARYGGEEFLLVLPNADALVAQMLAQNLRSSIESLGLVHAQSSYGRVTVSIGVAASSDGGYADPQGMLRAADAALYRAKERGRNQVQLAPGPSPRALAAGAPLKLVQLIWRPAYASGNPHIDAQHQALFADANELLGALLACAQAHEVVALVEVFMAGIERHFREEEAIIAAAGYADAAAHAALHRALLEKAFDLTRRVRLGEHSVGGLFEYVAHELVARHILIADREFFPSLRPAPSTPAAQPG